MLSRASERRYGESVGCRDYEVQAEGLQRPEWRTKVKQVQVQIMILKAFIAYLKQVFPLSCSHFFHFGRVSSKSPNCVSAKSRNRSIPTALKIGLGTDLHKAKNYAPAIHFVDQHWVETIQNAKEMYKYILPSSYLDFMHKIHKKPIKKIHAQISKFFRKGILKISAGQCFNGELSYNSIH